MITDTRDNLKKKSEEEIIIKKTSKVKHKMWLTRVLNIVRVNEPIIKKHTNEFTGIEVGMKMTTDKAWTRRRVKMMTAHLYGRRKIHDIL